MMRKMKIADREIGGDSCFVVCEIGHNHQGSIEIAEQMIRAAAQCGADAVKLQKRTNESLYTREFFDQPYNSENAFGDTYGEHRLALEFGWSDYARLQEVAQEVGVILFATAFDKPSVDFCVEMGFPAIKIASGDLTNTPLISHATQSGLPILLSTGGGQLRDVERAVSLVPKEQLVLMQCTAMYPTPFDKLDLLVIGTYKSKYPDVVVGASLHDNGVAMAVAAYTLGARVLEKHMTLRRDMKGTDHAFSLEPQGFAKMVRDLRRLEVALGDGEKRRHPEESLAITKMSKSVFAARPLHAGHVLTEEDFVFLSPGTGLPPYMADQLVGQILARDIEKEEPIGIDHLQRASA